MSVFDYLVLYKNSEIAVNSTNIRGFISWNDTKDFYKVKLKEPGRLVIDIDSKMLNGIVNLFDAQGKLISWDSLGFYNGLPKQWSSRTDFEADTYYISVEGNDSYQGIYEMNVSFSPANNEEIEPNNQKELATPIQLTKPKTYRGFLSHSDQLDYYKIEMKYDGYLSINYSSEFSGYQLINEQNIVYDSYISSGAVESPEVSVRKTKLPKGVYYFVPSAQVLWQGGVYTMSFHAESAFTDVTSRYSEAVNFLAHQEVTNGISKDEFGINEKIKRADAAVWLAKILNLDTSDAAATPFKDVPKRAWGAINALKKENIMNGKSETIFGADDSLTRGEMALFLYRAN